MEGSAVRCLVHHVSGYTGTFLGFFGSYEECKEKSFRVVILSNQVLYEGQARTPRMHGAVIMEKLAVCPSVQ